MALKDKASCVVEFDRGGDFGTARRELAEGCYKMTASARGWDVAADLIADSPDLRRSPPPLPPPVKKWRPTPVVGRECDEGTVLLVYLLFFLSGFAALVCEVSWSRQVGLVVGNTAWAASLVLAAFFAGMAAGQSVGGRLSGRVRPLLGYGVAELAAAGWAALVPALLAAIDSAGLGDAATAALCFAALVPAAAAFGATLPFVAEHVASRPNGGRRVALAYGLNTAGGLVGVLAATAFVVVAVGVRGSGYLAAGLSAFCGLAGCALATRSQGPGRPTTPDEAARPVGSPGVWRLVAGVSGFVTLALEVIYARLFALVLHNSTYTFGAVVAVSLAGLALGAALVAALTHRVPPRRLAAAGCGLGAVAVAVSLVVFARLTGFDYVAPADTFGGYLAAVFGLVAAVVLPPAVLLGTAFPAALAMAAGGGGVGRLTAANTLAGAAGAVAAGFLLTPGVGLWGAFGVCVALAGLAGVGLFLADRRPRTASGAGLAVALAAVVAVTGPGRVSQSSGRNEEVVRRWEGEYGWIDVTRSRSDGSLRVRQNLHYRHGSTASAPREYRQGRLPLLLHPKPAEVAFLGLGTGLTAAPVVGDRDVESAVVVELIPEVVDAARLLADANRGVVDDPKVRVEVGDARHYLRRTDRRFDAVVADLFVPWEARAGYLYTAEFYADVRRRLKPGGLFCQWLALYQLGSEEFELIADTFAAAFPVATLWWGQLDGRYPMLALVGSEGPIDLDPGRLAARWDASGLPPGGADPELSRPGDLVGLYAGRWEARPGRTLNTDEHPRLEFAAPASHASGRVLSGPALRAYFDAVLARLPADGVPASGDNAARRVAAQRVGLFGATP